MCDSMFTVKPRAVSEANAEKNVQVFLSYIARKKSWILYGCHSTIYYKAYFSLVITLGIFSPFISQDFSPFER